MEWAKFAQLTDRNRIRRTDMAIGDLPIFAALKNRMQWHQTRRSVTNVTTTATNRNHFSVGGDPSRAMGARTMNSFEVMPEGNGVTLEEEMMKVTTNQMDYQAATTLYTRSIRMMKIALGKNV